jgi:hypothetical protein
MFDQDNAQIMAFTIPLWAGAALGLHRMTSVDGPRVMTPIGVPVKAGASAPPPPPQEDEDEAVQPEGGDDDEAAGPPAKASTPPKTSAPPAAAPSADTAEEGSGQEPVPA